MAKDILVNTNSGDLIIAKTNSQATLYDVVWGKLFDSDAEDYMNIVVPSRYVNQTKWSNNEYVCNVKATYYPSTKYFSARLVVKDIASDSYKLLTTYVQNSPSATSCVYYPTFDSRPQQITPCQLPIINAEGQYKVVFKRYNNSNISRAIIYSIVDLDFSIGKSDNQSAQLLVRCAPGKSYRYPTTGLGLTGYINSVVENTQLAELLQEEFKGDNKTVTSAEFDSFTGDLDVKFVGTKEADDSDLTDPTKLSLELFKLADDDYLRQLLKSSQEIVADNEGYIEELSALAKFFGLYDIDNETQLDTINATSFGSEHVSLNDKGGIVSHNSGYYTAMTMTLEAGKIYAICYPKHFYSAQSTADASGDKTIYYLKSPRFAVFDGDDAVFIDHTETLSVERLYQLQNFRECFIPLKTLTINFLSHGEKSWSKDAMGIFPVTDTKGNYKSILGISEDDTTGKLTAYISEDSEIQDIQIDTVTNQILVIK